ncbi:transmembrane protein 30Aa [Trichomycterus rosablanca]|uniref:transmembrane protein 30Aa n=1 Tax=Trichomycterus rosablanca TaxID=2290929 RepID=UPI002F350707
MSAGADEEKSEKPDNSAFKQQCLPAWQPVLTASAILPVFFIVALIFIPVGIGLFITSNQIKEFEIDYTGVEISSPCFGCSQANNWNTSCKCSMFFTLRQPFEGNVYMYYGLSNYYQNQRRYYRSKDDRQLNGESNALTNPNKECEPYRTVDDVPVAPCGALANSLFNDTLRLFYMTDNGSYIPIPLGKRDIAWWTDKHTKFRNPSGDNFTSMFEGTSKPLNWHRHVYQLDPADPDNNGFINEDFIVWMRTAAMPNFRKLYRIIFPKDNHSPTLPAGNYSLHINYNYPVLSFDGRKRMVLSTISWMGGRNPFLGILYIIVGVIWFILGVVLLVVHHKYGNQNNSSDEIFE